MHAQLSSSSSSSVRLAPQFGQVSAAPALRAIEPRRLIKCRKQVHVSSCLKCATQQLQQLIKLPQQSHNIGGNSVEKQQCQPMQEQSHNQQQDCHADLQGPAAWPQLALASAGWHSTPPTSSAGRVDKVALSTTSINSSSSFNSRRSSSSPGGRHRTGSVSAAAATGSSSGSPQPAATDRPQADASAQTPQAAKLSEQAQQHADVFPDILAPQPRQDWQQQDRQQQQQQGTEAAQEEGVDSPGVRAALAALKWYKGFLSPSMASSCRFLPTCSQYSMDSYKKYGVAKGTVLTAWRLLRCNPWGGSGYDPTSWPPVGLAPLFQLPYSAEVAVVVGAAVFVRFTHALLFE